VPADNRQLANTKPISHGLSDTCKIARWAKGGTVFRSAGQPDHDWVRQSRRRC